MSRKTKPLWEILCLKNENEVKKIKLIFDQVRLKKDQALARKLKNGTKSLDILAHTSAEKYHKNGWFRQSVLNFFLLIQYLLGKDPHQLFKVYYKN